MLREFPKKAAYSSEAYGRGAGVGRGRGVGCSLGVGLGLAVAVGVADAVAVAVAVGVAVAVAVAVAVGVGVGEACGQSKISIDDSGVTPSTSYPPDSQIWSVPLVSVGKLRRALVKDGAVDQLFVPGL